MLYGAQTGESSIVPGFKTSLKDGDVAELIITNIGLPFNYTNSIETKNQELQAQAKKTGIIEEELTPSYKEGGLAIEVAAIYTVDSDGIETDHDSNFDNDKSLYHTIVIPTPKQFLERGWDIKDQRRGGKIVQGPKAKPYIGAFTKSDEAYPIIDDIYPSPKETQVWIDRVIIKEASAITEEDLKDDRVDENGKTYAEIFKKAQMNEEKRLASWEKMIKLWENWTEIECRNFLHLAFASRFLFHDAERKSGAEYHLPKVGSRFTAKVSRPMGKDGKPNKYTNFLSFEWSKETQHWEYYSEGTIPPTDEDVAYAEQINAKKLICFAS